MEQLLTSLLIELNGPDSLPPHKLLNNAAAIINQTLQADLALVYELIPETGGVPRPAPTSQGQWLMPDQSRPLLEANLHQCGVSPFIED